MSKAMSRTATKTRALTLRPHEARRLAETGRVLIVREVDAPTIGPNSGGPIREVVPSLLIGPGLWDVRYESDNPYAARCPFGPVGSELWGRETWSPDHAAFYPHWPRVYGADGFPAHWEVENGRIYSDEVQQWFPFRWRSPATMPRSASRFPRLILTACEVKRAGVTKDIPAGRWFWFATIERSDGC